MAAEKNPKKGIRKVNLNDLKGSLSKRGRDPFFDADLKAAFEELADDETNEMVLVWDDGFVDPNKNDDEQSRLKAKFRQRANSIVQQVVEEKKKNFAITIRYTDGGEMVITKREVKA